MDIVKATGVNTFHKVRSTNISIHTEERENFCSFAKQQYYLHEKLQTAR